MTVRYEEGHPEADSAIKHYGVQRFPTVLVLSAAGAELDEVGPDAPAEFIKELARIRAGIDTLPALRSYLADHPRDAPVLLKLARKLAHRHAEEAFAHGEKALANIDASDRERYAEALFLLAYIEENRNRVDEALAWYERIVDEYPHTKAAASAGLAATNILPDVEPERGLRFLERAMRLADPAWRPDLEYARGYLYYRAAEAEWLKRGREAGDEPEVLNAVAYECYLRNWHTKEAITWARRAVALSKRAPHILDTLACLLFRDGNVDEAVSIEQEALDGAKGERLRSEIRERLVQFQAVQRLRAERRSRAPSGK